MKVSEILSFKLKNFWITRDFVVAHITGALTRPSQYPFYRVPSLLSWD
jgi:hypothetical protein